MLGNDGSIDAMGFMHANQLEIAEISKFMLFTRIKGRRDD